MIEHVRKWHVWYRTACAVQATGFLLGWFWGSHPLWQLGPTAAYAIGASAPRFPVPPLQILFVALLIPTIASIADRVDYLWLVPYPQTADIIAESIMTSILLLVLGSAVVLVFLPEPKDSE